MDVKVSVLITLCNQEKYVEKALNSVIEQETDFLFEILIGNDHSTDGTADRIRSVLRQKQCKATVYDTPDAEKDCPPGFRASRNRLNLLKHAKGEYFIFLDGDDFFCDKKKLQKQVEVLEQNNNKDCIACGHSIKWLYPDGREELQQYKRLEEGKLSCKEYWSDYYFHTNTILFRSSVIPYLSAELLKNTFNDNIITYFALQYGKIYYLPIYAATYVQTGTGIWTGERATISAIRNMMLYDLANIINPKMRITNDFRLCTVWTSMYRQRKKMSVKNFMVYYDEACRHNLYYTKLWIDYNNMPVINKIGLNVQMWIIKMENIGIRIYRKLKRMIGFHK